MSPFRKASVGFVLAPGGRTRAADVVSVQSILAFLLRTSHFYVGEALGPTRLLGGDLVLVADATYEDCPDLDVLVVGEVSEEALRPDGADGTKPFLRFVRERAARAEVVVGISTGVLALAAAGVLGGRRVTAGRDPATVARLTDLGATAAVPGEEDSVSPNVVVDGKFYTAGPSTGAIEAAYRVVTDLAGAWYARFCELSLEYDPIARYADVPAPTSDVLSKAWAEAKERPLRVGVVLPAHVYLPDVMGAVDVLSRLPGTEFRYLWTSPSRPCYALLGPGLMTNASFDSCPHLDVVILGAMLPHVSSDADLRAFLRKQAPRARAVIATCAGVLTLGGAGLLEGRVATTNFHMTGLLPCVGARPASGHVVVDGKIHTAGPAVGSYEAGLRVVETVHGSALAREVEGELLQFRPRPLYDAGTPEKAGRWLTFLARLSLAPFLPIFRWYASRGYRESIRQSRKIV